MDGRKVRFLKAVLGEDGATALQKAALRSETLESLLIPRTVLAWLGLATRSEYRGQIPGVANTYISFKKNEDGFDGEISVADEIYSFNKASLYHLAASVAVSMGADKEKASPDLRDIDLTRLGKSIDLLIKARAVTRELLNKRASKAAPKKKAVRQDLMDGQAALEKTLATDALPERSKKKLPRSTNKPKISLKLSERQLESKCPVCACSQVSNGRFVGCMCFRTLSKSVKVEKEDKTFFLTFGSGWDRDVIEVFLQSLGNDSLTGDL